MGSPAQQCLCPQRGALEVFASSTGRQLDWSTLAITVSLWSYSAISSPATSCSSVSNRSFTSTLGAKTVQAAQTEHPSTEDIDVARRTTRDAIGEFLNELVFIQLWICLELCKELGIFLTFSAETRNDQREKVHVPLSCLHEGLTFAT